MKLDMSQKVDLTDEQAALFILFQKHYDAIGMLVGCHVFDIKNGAASLYFRGGKLKTIKREVITGVEELPIEDTLSTPTV